MLGRIVPRTLLCCRQPTSLVRPSSLFLRCLTTAMPETRTNEDMVKAAIHKIMIQQQQQHETTCVTQEALQKASFRLKRKLDEVRACLTDVQEEEDRQAEVATTDRALEEAAAAYVDLLDLVREADETTALQFKQIREASATEIRQLRHALDKLRQEEETPLAS